MRELQSAMGNNDIASVETFEEEQLDKPMSTVSNGQTRRVYGPTELRYVFSGRRCYLLHIGNC